MTNQISPANIPNMPTVTSHGALFMVYTNNRDHSNTSSNGNGIGDTRK